MNSKITNLYDEYNRGRVGRRDFLERLAQLAGGSAAALALLPVLQKDHASAQIIPENDERLQISSVDYDADGTKMSGYLVRIKGTEKLPAVIVIHENRGLTAHIKDVARRMALEGFLVLAPDALSPLGGTPEDEDKGREMLSSTNADENAARLAAAVPFLAGHAESTGKVGVTGFCWGGGMSNRIAAIAGASLNAAAPYYGAQLPAEEVPKITAPLLLHYGALDERINAGIPAYEAALKANNKTYEIYMYEGAQHAFNNDTNPPRYNKEAAQLAWKRTVSFFKKYLAS